MLLWLNVILLFFSSSGVWARETRLNCPYIESVTWDYIDTVTLHLDKTTMQAKFCILCRDYYAASQEKDYSQYNCTSLSLNAKQAKRLLKMTPAKEKLADFYVIKCENDVKSTLEVEDIVRGDCCYSKITGGYYAVTIKQEENFDSISSFIEPDWKVNSCLWRLLWLLSVTFNVLLLIALSTIVGSFHYKRNLADLWRTSLAGPKMFVDSLKQSATLFFLRIRALLCSSSTAEHEEETNSNVGDYLAHDIDFRTTLRLSTINNRQVTPEEENGVLTISSIDVINYNQPKDFILSDAD